MSEKQEPKGKAHSPPGSWESLVPGDHLQHGGPLSAERQHLTQDRTQAAVGASLGWVLVPLRRKNLKQDFLCALLSLSLSSPPSTRSGFN